MLSHRENPRLLPDALQYSTSQHPSNFGGSGGGFVLTTFAVIGSLLMGSFQSPPSRGAGEE
jgi:hypothetical protein